MDRIISDLIWGADAQVGDPLAWAGNQAGHVLIIGGLIVAILGLLRWPLWIGALVYAVWECWHTLTTRDWQDGLTDWAFVLCGMVLMRAAWRGDRRDLLLAYCGVITAGAVGMWVRA